VLQGGVAVVDIVTIVDFFFFFEITIVDLLLVMLPMRSLQIF
jgi:hypothetical protein